MFLVNGALEMTDCLYCVNIVVLQSSQQDGDATTAVSAARLAAVFPHVWLLVQSGSTVHEPD